MKALLVAALLAQVAHLPAPVGEPTMPEYVIISGQWYTGSPCFSAGNDSCSPGWTIEAEAVSDLMTLVETLGGGDWHDGWRGVYETHFDRRLIGVWSLKTGKRVEVKFETRERSEPEKIEARKWTERRVVVEGEK